MEQQRFRTLEEVAEVLRLHLDTMRRYAREGKIKTTKIGKRYLVSAEDLERFIAGGGQMPERPAKAKKGAAKKAKA